MDTFNKTECQESLWDDTLLIKAYDDSITLAREDLARRIAITTTNGSQRSTMESNTLKSAGIEIMKKNKFKVGDYVRATYEDGVDYEAKILKIDEISGTCALKYIGYENEQKLPLDNLVLSWGKKARRLQFAKAKLESSKKNSGNDSENRIPKRNISNCLKTIPPPPPMPPMLSSTSKCDDSEHLSAMLMSWYMSGYYTGIYQGMQIAKSSSENNSK